MYQNSYSRRLPVKPSRSKAPLIIVCLLLIVLAAGAFFLVTKRAQNTATPKTISTDSLFNKTKFSLDDPASPWVVANKKRPLNPKQYQPSDLTAPNIPLSLDASDPGMQVRTGAATALEALVTAAKQEGVELVLLSGYRSYQTQVATYNSEVKAYGQTQADRESARPGHSEHQTGWAADLGAKNGKCRIQACFGDTREGKWLAANAYKHGFILRYTPDKEAITGYTYEPWHLRYIGPTLAAELHRTNTQTLEEFFNLPAAPSY